jgi:hypothetical protein
MFLVLRHGRYVRTQSNYYFRMNCVEKSAMPNLPLAHILIVSPTKSLRKRRRLAVRLFMFFSSIALIIGWIIMEKSI